jgi:hypothetical protein
MTRDEFMDLVYSELYSDGDNYRANRIIDAADGYAEDCEPRWIPCSERMPEDEYVLISKKPTKISGSKWSVTIAIRTADPRSGEVGWRDIGFGKIPDDYVLAWMPLPNCYQGDEK